MSDDRDKDREREFDALTFVLAGVLSAIILGAVGYGISKSSRMASPLPPQIETSGSR